MNIDWHQLRWPVPRAWMKLRGCENLSPAHLPVVKDLVPDLKILVRHCIGRLSVARKTTTAKPGNRSGKQSEADVKTGWAYRYFVRLVAQPLAQSNWWRCDRDYLGVLAVL